MGERVLELGDFLLDQVCARCDACRSVQPAVQFTGPNGYVTLCLGCMLKVTCIPVTIRGGGLNG